MSKKEILTIINIGRNKLAVCSAGSGGISTIELGADVVTDLTVIDFDKLVYVVGGFVKQSQLTPGPLLMILAREVCFEHEIVRSAGMDVAIEVQKFLDTVPLTSVSSKVFETDKGYMAVAIGREFYEALRSAWEQVGFVVKVVVPGYVLGAVGVGEVFDAGACQMVMRNLGTLSEHGFELESKKEETFSQVRSKFFNTHKVWVIGFFVISLVMLALVAFLVFRKPGP